MDPTRNDFNFNWTTDWNAINTPYSSFQKKKVYDNYEKRDSFSIRSITVQGTTSSSEGIIEASECFLNHVSGRDGVSLYNCSALETVSSSMGKIIWDGWKGVQTKLPDVIGRDGVNLSNISVKNVKSSKGNISVNNGKANDVSGKDGVLLADAAVHNAYTSRGILAGKHCSAVAISAGGGVELIDSDAGSVTSSMGTVQAQNSQITGKIDARDGVKIKNCTGTDIVSSMGKIHALSEKLSLFNSLNARDGVYLENISSKNVISSMGPVNCNGGDFDSIKSKGSSSLKRANVQFLEISVERGEEIIVDLTDSVVNSVAIKVGNAVSSSSEYTIVETHFSFGGGGGNSSYLISFGERQPSYSKMTVSGNSIVWLLDDSTLKASPKNFSVNGELSNKFQQDILKRCVQGTLGMVNGVPAKVTPFGVELQQNLNWNESQNATVVNEISTKVNIVGGKILGNISKNEPVKFDITRTTLIGEIV